MLQTPRFAANDERIARRRRSRQRKALGAAAQLGYTAVALMVAFVLFAFAIVFWADADWLLSLIPVAGMIVLGFLYVLSWRGYRRHVAAANALLAVSTMEQTYLLGAVDDVPDLVAAASEVATALHHRRDIVMTRQHHEHAQREAAERQQRFLQAQRRITASTAYPSCLGGCGSRALLTIGALAAVLLLR